MEGLIEQQRKLPKTPGVYLFKNALGEIIYIGKATVLRTRVSSYFRRDVDKKTAQLVAAGVRLDYIQTETALEALFLEAKLIRQHLPLYNIRQKDDKTSAYLIVTDEQFPRLEITRPTALQNYRIKKSYGPFFSKRELLQALKVLRPVFPYHSDKSLLKPCFHFQIGLCPGPCAGAISQRDYLKNIRSLMLIFEGKKQRIERRLEREMKKLSKEHKFERAAAIRNTLYSLKHIRDITLAREETIDWKIIRDIPKRIEGYDISNISGRYAVGSMVVFSYGRKDAQEYRRFKIRMDNTPNDTAMLQEILRRRFRNDWDRPSVIFVDGGIGQLRAAQIALKEMRVHIPVISAAKGPDRKGFRVFKSREDLKVSRELLKSVSAEAHRFAISYHRKLRDRNFLQGQ